jgi:predicted ribonuclease YlaK
MTTSKTYVCDTTVLIEDPDVFYKTGGQFVIPLVVMRELDGLKKSDDMNVAKAARQVSRTLDRIGSYADLTKGVELSTGSILKILNAYDRVDALASDADNKVIGTALKLRREGAGDVVLVSTDGNMRIVARALGVKSAFWPDERGEQDMFKERREVSGDGRSLKQKNNHPRIVIALFAGTLLSAGAFFISGIPEKLAFFFGFSAMACFTVLLIGGISGLLGGDGNVSFKYESIAKLEDSSSPSADLSRDFKF